MRAFVAVTDWDWFRLLSSRPDLTEINFWQPSGNTVFRALNLGELFLFKLHSPRNFIVGGGFLGHSTLLPVSLAWETFGEANGAHSLQEMRQRIEHYRKRPGDRFQEYTIGCIILEQPFFLPESEWIPAPDDWKRNVVRGAGYDDSTQPGRRMLEAIETALTRERVESIGTTISEPAVADKVPRYGKGVLVRPRLGQGAFRFAVTDAYQRRCAITRERTLPVLIAAHIRPYAKGGEHRADNGLLLRSDLHTLFDRGYVTVTPDYHIEVSRRIREEFENGRDYYALHAQVLNLPRKRLDYPSQEFLAWHNETVFRG